MSLPEYSRILPEIALNFDQVLLEPAASSILPKDTDINTRFSRGIPLSIPFAVYTATAEEAVEAAQFGSIGIIPFTSAISKQADIVRKVKRFQSHIVRNPVSLPAESSIVEALEIQQRYGLNTIPVTENGQLNGYLVLDDKVSFDDVEKTVHDFISSMEVITLTDGAERNEAHDLMQQKNADYVALVDKDNRFVGLVTREDKEKLEKFPKATIDNGGCLRVIACVGTGEDHYDRVSSLIDAGVDGIMIDAPHGHSKAVSDMVIYIRRQRSGHVDVIVGNVVTADGTLALIDSGADAIKIGQQIPALTATMQVGDSSSLHNIPAIATASENIDNAVKAFAGGASALIITLGERKISEFSKELDEKLRLAMSETGCATIREFNSRPRFVRISK